MAHRAETGASFPNTAQSKVLKSRGVILAPPVREGTTPQRASETDRQIERRRKRKSEKAGRIHDPDLAGSPVSSRHRQSILLPRYVSCLWFFFSHSRRHATPGVTLLSRFATRGRERKRERGKKRGRTSASSNSRSLPSTFPSACSPIAFASPSSFRPDDAHGLVPRWMLQVATRGSVAQVRSPYLFATRRANGSKGNRERIGREVYTRAAGEDRAFRSRN